MVAWRSEGIGAAGRWVDRRALLLLLLACACAYGALYVLARMAPGLPQPLGWFAWYDQGLYLRGATAFANGDFDPAAQHYPPLYALLGAILLPVLPLHSWFPVNLALLLGFATLMFALMAPFAGRAVAVGALLASLFVHHVHGLQWVVPWTSSLSAVLVAGALVLLARRLRPEHVSTVGAFGAVREAFAFGLLIALLLPTRPGDLAGAAPVALAYAWYVARDLLGGSREARAPALGAVFAGLGAVALVLAAMALFHGGTGVIGSYGTGILGVGVDPATFPMRLHGHVLDSAAFFGEARQDWASRLPLTLVAFAVLPVTLVLGPPILRVASAAALVHIFVTYSFNDALPTGQFRFLNIHYLKWAVPIAYGALAYWLVALIARGTRKRAGVALALAALALALGVSTRAVPVEVPATVERPEPRRVTITLPEATIVDVARLGPVGGAWTTVYFDNQSEVVVDGEKLLAFRDFRVLPEADGGARLLLHGHRRVGRIELTLASPVAPSGGAADVRVSTLRFVFDPVARPDR
jgi:hypothetical protein